MLLGSQSIHEGGRRRNFGIRKLLKLGIPPSLYWQAPRVWPYSFQPQGHHRNERQRHDEASRVRNPDQLLRVGAGLSCKTTAEAIRVALEGAALGRDRALAVLGPTPPGTSSMRFHRSSSAGSHLHDDSN